jgi:hypothetical protein
MENGTTPLVTIVRAGISHLPVLREFWLTMLAEQRTFAFYPFPNPDDDDRITQDLAVVLQSPLFNAVIAYDGDTPVGFAAAEQQERRFGSPRYYAYLHGIYVIKPYRKHTVSVRLCLTLGAWFTDMKLEVVECDNPSAHPPWWKAVGVPFKLVYSRYVAVTKDAVQAGLTWAAANDPSVVPVSPPPEVDLALIAALPDAEDPKP